MFNWIGKGGTMAENDGTGALKAAFDIATSATKRSQFAGWACPIVGIGRAESGVKCQHLTSSLAAWLVLCALWTLYLEFPFQEIRSAHWAERFIEFSDIGHAKTTQIFCKCSAAVKARAISVRANFVWFSTDVFHREVHFHFARA